MIANRFLKHNAFNKWFVSVGSLFVIGYILYAYRTLNANIILIAFAIIIGFIIYEKPLWGLCFASIAELLFANYFLLGNYYLRVRLILLPFILIIILTSYAIRKVHIKLNKVAVIFIGIVAAMVIIVFMVGISQNSSIPMLFRQVSRVAVAAVIVFLIFILVDDMYKLKIYLSVTISALMLSCIIGILQVTFGEPFYALRQFFISKSNLAMLTVYGEASGFALYSLPLAYQIICVLPLCFSVLLLNARHITSRIKVYLAIICVVLGITLIMTFSRSALLGMAVWIVGLVFLKTKGTKYSINKKRLLFFFVIIIAIITIFSSNLEQIFTFKDESARDRLPLFTMGIKIFTLHPFGIGSSARYNEYSIEHFDFFEDKSAVSSAVKRMAPHNQFLNTLLYWGFPALLLLVFFFIYKIRTLIRIINTTKNNYILSLAFGLIGISIAYIFHSFFHNAGPFLGDIFYWHIIGIIPALYNIDNKIKSEQVCKKT